MHPDPNLEQTFSDWLINSLD